MPSRQQLIEKISVSFAVGLEVRPLPSDISAGMEHDDPLIENVTRGILLDHSHDPADELHEGRQIAENAEDGRNRQVRVVEPFAQLTNLNDDIDLVVFQPLHHALVGDAGLTRMHIVGTATTSTISFDDFADNGDNSGLTR